MSRSATWFGGLLLLASVSVAGAAPARFVIPGVESVGSGAYRADRIEVRLKPWAAATARVSLSLATAAEPNRARPSSAVLGLAALDRVAATAGVVAFAPEFRGETPRAPGAGVDFTAFYLAALAPGSSAEAALAALRALPEVESADPIAVLPGLMVPNDSLYSTSWWFGAPPGINEAAAWDLSAGDTSTVIAILDTGVLPWHPDLGGDTPGSSGQIWTNAAEANGVAGVDDDGNGYIDDVHGWDYVALSGPGGITGGEDWRDEDNDPNDFAGHGTECAGLAAALTNNSIGVAGAAWRSRVLPLRIAWSQPGAINAGAFDMSYAAQAIRYATRAGAKVISCSFATVNEGGLFAAVDDATRAGVLVVSAGGNGDPCAIPASDCHELADREDVLAVGALAPTGQIASFSETGEYIDVFAPGEAIQSTAMARVVGDSVTSRLPAYSLASDGTSWSTPIAAGVAAQVIAYDRATGQPPLRPMELQFRLRENAGALHSVPAVTLAQSGSVGQLDAARAIANRNVSFGIRAGARTTGAAVGFVRAGTARVAAYATSDSALLFLSARGDTLRRVALGAGVVGSPASARFGAGGTGVFVALDNATVAGFDALGSPLAGWPVATDASDDPPGAGPSIGDVDGDGSVDVVCPTISSTVYVWRANGSRIAPFPVLGDGAMPAGTVALAPLDSVAGLELVLGTQSNKLYVFRAKATAPLLPGWPKTVAAGLRAPLVMRLGRTGAPAIVAVYGTSVRAFLTTGAIAFTRVLGGQPADDPVAADLDGDGVDEIIVPLTSPEGVGVVDSLGMPRPGWPVTFVDPVSGPPLVRVTTPYDAALASVLVPSGRRLLAFDAGGAPRGEFPKPGHAGDAASLYDLGGDAHERVLAGSGADSLIYFYLPPGSAGVLDVASSWTTARGDFARTASRLPVPAAPPVSVGPLSNVPAPAVISLSQPSRAPATLFWKAPPGMTRQTLSLYDVGGRLRRTFDLGAGVEGSVVWNGADASGELLGSGVYFLRYTGGGAHASARIVLIK